MKIRKVLLLITALAVLLTLSACRREKYYVSSEALETVMSDELYFGVPDYIVRGTVTKMVEEYFTAPDGPSYENAHVTVYELEITESYKGTLSEETVLLENNQRRGIIGQYVPLWRRRGLYIRGAG